MHLIENKTLFTIYFVGWCLKTTIFLKFWTETEFFDNGQD